MKFLFFLVLLFMMMVSSCARAPVKSRETAMRRVSPPEISDGLGLESLKAATREEIRFLEGGTANYPQPANLQYFVFGKERYTTAEYIVGLKYLIELIEKLSSEPKDFYRAVQEDFDFYEVYGNEAWGEVFITSYFEPVISGSRSRTKKFSMPLYEVPQDLVSVDLTLFDPKFEPERKYRGRVKDHLLIPYFSREEIDGKQMLKGKGLEICWVDPIDAFFLQIQGSGTVELKEGKRLFLVYGEKNGHRYEAIGKFLKDAIPIAKMNAHTIEEHLRSLSHDDMLKVLFKNPSYVFFKPSNLRAITSLGVPATDGRTIATDARYFPKGALAWLSFPKPIMEDGSLEPKGFVPTAQFVFDQDVGGAISGGGRVDLFWGRGEEGKRYSGVMQNTGRLYYLAPKR